MNRIIFSHVTLFFAVKIILVSVQATDEEANLIAFVDHLEILAVNTSDPFCYSQPSCGPSSWPGICADGMYQSPINLDLTSSVKQSKRPGAVLDFQGSYKTQFKKFYITNNGHTVMIQLNPQGTSPTKFCQKDVNLCYVFAQLHFHWSDSVNRGSEHLLNNKAFPMEIHLVHYRAMYSNLGEALQSSDTRAVAVLGVFVKVGQKKNTQLVPIISQLFNYALKPIDGLAPVFGAINLFKLLPKKKSFFRYSGSLTTPPCTEKVFWLVFQQPIQVSNKQMAMFRKVFAPTEVKYIMSNYRPVQPRSGRTIEYFT